MSLTSSTYWKDKFQRASLRAKVSVIDPFMISCPYTPTASIDWGSLKMPVFYSSTDPCRSNEFFETVHYPALIKVLNAPLKCKNTKSKNRFIGFVKTAEMPLVFNYHKSGSSSKNKKTRPQTKVGPKQSLKQRKKRRRRIKMRKGHNHGHDLGIAIVPTPKSIQREFAKYGMEPIGGQRKLALTQTTLSQTPYTTNDCIKEESVLKNQFFTITHDDSQKQIQEQSNKTPGKLRSLVNNISPQVLSAACSKAQEVITGRPLLWTRSKGHGIRSELKENQDIDSLLQARLVDDSRHYKNRSSNSSSDSSNTSKNIFKQCYYRDSQYKKQVRFASTPVSTAPTSNNTTLVPPTEYSSVDEISAHNLARLFSALLEEVSASSTSPNNGNHSGNNHNVVVDEGESSYFTNSRVFSKLATKLANSPSSSFLQRICGPEYTQLDLDEIVLEYLVTRTNYSLK